jgi:hypothetical protein
MIGDAEALLRGRDRIQRMRDGLDLNGDSQAMIQSVASPEDIQPDSQTLTPYTADDQAIVIDNELDGSFPKQAKTGDNEALKHDVEYEEQKRVDNVNPVAIHPHEANNPPSISDLMNNIALAAINSGRSTD